MSRFGDLSEFSCKNGNSQSPRDRQKISSSALNVCVCTPKYLSKSMRCGVHLGCVAAMVGPLSVQPQWKCVGEGQGPVHHGVGLSITLPRGLTGLGSGTHQGLAESAQTAHC